MRMIQPNELKCPLLSQEERAVLFLALNAHLSGVGKVHVSFRYSKQTDSPARIAGQDYQDVAGVATDAVLGPVTVKFYVDNPQNRKQARVGKPYLHVLNALRANGVDPFGHESVQIDAIREFKLQGVVVAKPETTQYQTEG